jgi:hypothetical protein
MSLPNPSLAKICLEISKHIEFLGKNQNDLDWKIITGAPGVNLADTNIDTNTLNVFYYRFEPAGLNASTGVGDIHWMRVFCIITAFGFDDNDDKNIAGINELRMLSEVVRLFQEQPIKLFKGNNDEDWHTQFIPRPLADEQINQIWSTQGSVVYRPSIAYEIALAPIEPLEPTPQSARVASIGFVADSDIKKRHSPWSDAQRDSRFPLVPSISIDISNPQWTPAIAMITGQNGRRLAHLTLSLEAVKIGPVTIPDIDIWIAGDSNDTVFLMGQLFQNNSWQDIDIIPNVGVDTTMIDNENLPPINGTNFKLLSTHWSGFDNTHKSWQLQLFAQRTITINNIEIRIRSNPLLIAIARDES